MVPSEPHDFTGCPTIRLLLIYFIYDLNKYRLKITLFINGIYPIIQKPSMANIT